MTGRAVPDPLPGAGKKAGLAVELVAAVLPPLGMALKYYMERRLEEGLQILVDRVARIGVSSLDELTEGQRAYLLPSAYCFAESVRLGEYEYNLHVIAEMIAGEWSADNAAGEPGKIQRAARRLSGLEYDVLVAFAGCAAAFDRHSRDMGEEYGYSIISPKSLVDAYGDTDRKLSVPRAAELLVEIYLRGLLIQEPVLIVGSTVYRKNTAFNELIEAAKTVTEQV